MNTRALPLQPTPRAAILGIGVLLALWSLCAPGAVWAEDEVKEDAPPLEDVQDVRDPDVLCACLSIEDIEPMDAVALGRPGSPRTA